jgi:hypothetical protein
MRKLWFGLAGVGRARRRVAQVATAPAADHRSTIVWLDNGAEERGGPTLAQCVLVVQRAPSGEVRGDLLGSARQVRPGGG